MKASARKTKFGYRPMIVDSEGRTELLGKRAWYNTGENPYKAPGEFMGWLPGKSKPTREEAIAYAQKVIDHRAKFAAERKKEWEVRQARYAEQRKGEVK